MMFTRRVAAKTNDRPLNWAVLSCIAKYVELLNVPQIRKFWFQHSRRTTG
jgi:hypothetical protein